MICPRASRTVTSPGVYQTGPMSMRPSVPRIVATFGPRVSIEEYEVEIAPFSCRRMVATAASTPVGFTTPVAVTSTGGPRMS
jgi:hypothetical protein